LHAAVALERPPNRCIVFSGAAGDVVAAHENEMRCVGVMGARGVAYELKIADLVVEDLDGVVLQDIRRLFADVEFDPMPELETLLEAKAAEVDFDDYDDYDDFDDDGGGGGGAFYS